MLQFFVFFLQIYYLLFRPLCCNFNAIQGDEIHVVCKQDQLKSWKMDFKENCTYVMHNCKVLKNNDQYRVCDHQFKLVFIGVTVVRQCVQEDLPFRKYRFAGFADVVASQFEPGLLVGMLTYIFAIEFIFKVVLFLE